MMKTVYEITRPIIAQVSLDGNLEIPISYAYDLYKPDILGRFSKIGILTQWQTLVTTAEHDSFVRDYFDKLMNRGWLRLDALPAQFWERFNKSNLPLMTQQHESSLTEEMFEELIKSKGFLDDTNNDRLYGVVSWYGFVHQLVHGLDDITSTFDTADIDFFIDVVQDMLEILDWREHVVAKLND